MEPLFHITLFHITTRAAWREAQSAGVYRASSLDQEGFIHLSTADQWPRTLRRFFGGATDLALLVIDPAKLAATVRYEAADGEHFPHLYGPLNLDAVQDVRSVD